MPTIKHGLQKHSAYQVWRSLIKRCTNPTDKDWHNYGGRGITVCERWLSITSFVHDMGERPAGMTIERINNDLGYSPDNCRWATRPEQMRNTRQTRLITFNGKTQCLKDWACEIGIDRASLRQRLAKYPLEIALTRPKRIYRREITLNGETLNIAQWSKKCGVNRRTLSTRFRAGWSDSKALTTPVR